MCLDIFNRIYTLDTQIKHLDNKSTLNFGKWLQRKWINMSARKLKASEILDQLAEQGITKEFLSIQWENQIAEQTKPLKKQSKSLADKEIQEILLLTKNVENYKAQIDEYRTMIELENYENGLDITDIQPLLEENEIALKKIRKSIQNKRLKLSVDDKVNLKSMLGNEFLRKRINALALKERIRERLRQRKFELENLERAYRKTANNMKFKKNIEGKVKRKEPGIQALARNYNKLCQELKQLILLKKSPLGALSPVLIELGGLISSGC